MGSGALGPSGVRGGTPAVVLFSLPPPAGEAAAQVLRRFLGQGSDFAREFVGERGGGGGEAGGIQRDLRPGDFGEGFQVFHVVPDQAEVAADLLDQAGGGPAAPSVFEGGEVGGGDVEARRHGGEADLSLGAQGAQVGAERGHDLSRLRKT